MASPGTGSGARAGAVGGGGQRHLQPLAGGHPVRLGRGPPGDQDVAAGDQVRRGGRGTGRTCGPAPRRAARRPALRERPPGAGRRRSRLAVPRPGPAGRLRRGVLRCCPAGPLWCRPAGFPRAASSTARTPPHTMHESATLKTGQCGSWIQSTTSPRNTPGERSSRSVRFPAAPPSSSPSVTAQGRLRSRREVRRMKMITPIAMAVNTTVMPGAEAERRPAVAGQVQVQQAADQPDRLVRRRAWPPR